MGIFSNNKKQCPICGNATPRLLARKIEDYAICSNCDGKIFMRKDRLNNLTLDEFTQYLEYYDGTENLRKEYKPDFEKSAGFLGGKAFSCDSVQHTFKTSLVNNNLVYQPEHFVSLIIKQDETPVFELTKDSLVIHNTGVLEKIDAIRPEVDAYNTMYQLTNSVIRLNNDMERAKEGRARTFEEMREEEDPTRDQRNDFRCTVPFSNWIIELSVDHPWGEGLSDKNGQSFFDSKNPSIEKAVNQYLQSFDEYKNMALAFRTAICPNAQIIDEFATTVSAAAPATSNISAADELKKFKELMDAGVITPEEFAAKKAQLLGI